MEEASYINQNAYFTNGRQVTAEDVKFSLERVPDKEVSPRGYNSIGPISSVEVKDEFTVLIKLTKTYLDLPVDLGGVYPRISSWLKNFLQRQAYSLKKGMSC